MCPVFGILFADILCRIFYRTKSNYLICKCIRNRKQWQRNNGPAKYFPYGWWVNEQPTDPNIERDRERKREMRANEHERTKRKSERETERQSFFSSLYSTGTFSVHTKYNTTCRISLAYTMNIYIYIYRYLHFCSGNVWKRHAIYSVYMYTWAEWEAYEAYTVYYMVVYRQRQQQQQIKADISVAAYTVLIHCVYVSIKIEIKYNV